MPGTSFLCKYGNFSKILYYNPNIHLSYFTETARPPSPNRTPRGALFKGYGLIVLKLSGRMRQLIDTGLKLFRYPNGAKSNFLTPPFSRVPGEIEGQSTNIETPEPFEEHLFPKNFLF
ncbi:MAG: hypothetical protein CM15mP111_1230 [Hyphomicrobiales bacterium]|nr:MAG: hypothetical protein CM15mP111_1230 [Hyphomicrobiales bacterium]